MNPSILVAAAITQDAGVKADATVAKSGRDPQSAYTGVVQQMKTDGSNYASSGLAAANMIELRSEAQLQGIDAKSVVWQCTAACYDRSYLDAGDVVDGTYLSLGFLPFDETRSNATLADYVKYVGKDKVSGLGVYAFAATLAFRDVVAGIVADHGVNGITRAAVLDGLQRLTSFDAGGLMGRTNVADKVSTSCFVLTQVRSGKFVRIHPKRKGTFDCRAANHVEIKDDFLK